MLSENEIVEVAAKRVQPKSLDELSACIRDVVGPLCFGVGSNPIHACRVPGPAATVLDLSGLGGIVSFEPADQVVVVRAGTSIAQLNKVLASEGQCIPHQAAVDTGVGTIGEEMSLNLPHLLEGQCGTWRDWVLGVTVVQADGTIAKGGSKAVKNVAGYDVQKLFIGARDSLGVVAEIILRTYPTKALPKPELESGTASGNAIWIQRTLRTDFERALSAVWDRLIIADRETCTLWCAVEESQNLPRYPSDWVIRAGCGEKNLPLTDPTQIRFMQRAKELFDPRHKLNPGVMGVF